MRVFCILGVERIRTMSRGGEQVDADGDVKTVITEDEYEVLLYFTRYM